MLLTVLYFGLLGPFALVYRLVAADTIEQKVLALQERKRDLFARVMDDDDGALAGTLTAEDIRGLFA